MLTRLKNQDIPEPTTSNDDNNSVLLILILLLLSFLLFVHFGLLIWLGLKKKEAGLEQLVEKKNKKDLITTNPTTLDI